LKPRLLIAGPLPPPIGGVESFTQALLESGAFPGFDVSHCDTTKGRPKATQGRFDTGNFAWAARHLMRMRRSVARDRPAVVYMPIAGTWSGFLRDMALGWVARRGGARLVGHVHGSDFHFVLERGGLDRRIVRSGLDQFDRLLVLGERWRGMIAGFGVRAPIDVVPSTFRREVFERAADSGPRPAPGVVTRILFVGQVGRRKGSFDLLRALPAVQAAGHHVHVTFVGPEEQTGEWEALMALRRELSLEAMTEFTGPLQGHALYEHYRGADLFVMPSYTEGLPIVLFEAGAFGLGVITSPVGAIPDLIVDDRNGLLVPPGEPGPLVAAIGRLAGDPEARVRLGRQLRQDIQAFHPDRVCALVATAVQATLAGS
jgi:glycosyltransferase involved in cell wall biosynthesis